MTARSKADILKAAKLLEMTAETLNEQGKDSECRAARGMAMALAWALGDDRPENLLNGFLNFPDSQEIMKEL